MLKIMTFVLKNKSKGRSSECFKQQSEMICFIFLEVHSDPCRKDCGGASVQAASNRPIDVPAELVSVVALEEELSG